MRKSDARGAARSSITYISRVRGRNTAGIITIDLKGGVGAAFNTEAMGRAWFDQKKGRVVARI
jgi:isoaspartyl peptidase/L-asparaginase-like protein (Ntn-hydrolase superfamily)